MTRKRLERIAIIILFLGLAWGLATTVFGARSCVEGVQAGTAEVVFEGSNWSRTAVAFDPVCEGEPILSASATGAISPGEVATGQALGPGNGAVSLALPFNWTGTAVVNWTVVGSTE